MGAAGRQLGAIERCGLKRREVLELERSARVHRLLDGVWLGIDDDDVGARGLAEPQPDAGAARTEMDDRRGAAMNDTVTLQSKREPAEHILGREAARVDATNDRRAKLRGVEGVKDGVDLVTAEWLRVTASGDQMLVRHAFS